MNEDKALSRILSAQTVIVILRSQGIDRSLAAAQKAWQIGIKCVEITVQRKEDWETLKAVVQLADGWPEAAVAAGTVLTAKDAELAVEVGASFIVSPSLSPEVISVARSGGRPAIPGVATPTEIHRALDTGCSWVKAFPAHQLGSSWFKTIRGPFPNVRTIATGGIKPSSADRFLSAGAGMVGISSTIETEAESEALARLHLTRKMEF